MKKIVSLALLAILAINLNLNATPQAVSQGSSADSVGTKHKARIIRASEKSGEAPKAAFFNLWLQGPPKGPGFEEFAISAISSLVQGVVPTNSIEFNLTAENMTTSMGKIPWNLIMVTGVGTNEVSISDLVTKVSSPQDKGLTETQEFGSSNYSPTASGLREGGEIIISGSGEQKVKAFILLVAPPTYTGTLDDVKAWFLQNASQFSITMEMTVGSDSARSTISTDGYNATFPNSLAIAKNLADEVVVNLPNGVPGKSYTLMGFSDLELSQGAKFVGNLSGTNSVIVPTILGEQLFLDFFPN